MKNQFALLGVLLLAAPMAWAQLQTTTLTASDRVTIGSSTLGAADLDILGKTGWSVAPTLRTFGDGGVIFSGTYGTGTLPTSSSGSSFIFYSRRAAVVGGGNVSATDSDIGNYSFAFGYSARATNVNNVALGSSAASTGNSAVAIGGGAYATGSYSTALIYGGAYGVHSYALGGQTWGTFSATLGTGSAYGDYSTAMGGGIASGTYSTALNTAAATADYSLAAGHGISGTCYSSTVLGAYNKSEGTSGTAWVPTDPLFTVANGTGVTTDAADVKNHNAFVVYKNGKIKMDRQGDILMGDFGN